jgi:hypothetical protein
MLGIAVFGLFLTATGLVLLHGQENTVVGGDRVRGTSYAQEALDATRAIRDGSFANLTDGAHGLALNGSSQWTFNGTNYTGSGGYIVSATITVLAPDWVRVVGETKWKHGYNRSGSVLITTELTDWRSARPAGDWSLAVLEGSYVDGGIPVFNAAAVAGEYAFATSDASLGGAGLYVFDISDTTSPQRVAATFTLGVGVSGYDVATKGRVLYVITSDSAQEIRAYDISAPTTLADGNLLASFNLSGSSLATSLRLDGSRLYVGAQQDATFREFYSFDVSNSNAIVPLASLETTTTLNRIARSGTSAFLATSDPVAEMKMVRATSSGGLSLLSNGDFNIASTERGTSVFATGTAALLGRLRGTGIQELVYFDARAAGGNPPPAALYHEGSGSLLGVDADPGKCYGFLAADSGRKAFQIINLRDPALGELFSYDSINGRGSGLFYDIVRDRVYVLTRSAFLIFRPTAASGTCV